MIILIYFVVFFLHKNIQNYMDIVEKPLINNRYLQFFGYSRFAEVIIDTVEIFGAVNCRLRTS
jgi:hypothetical protein